MQQPPNISYIKELSGEDRAFEQKFIKILKDEFPEEMRTYKEHIKQQELIRAAEMVHKLKHKFNILSMSNAYEFAVHYEEELREGRKELDVDFLPFLQTITNYLKTI